MPNTGAMPSWIRGADPAGHFLPGFQAGASTAEANARMLLAAQEAAQRQQISRDQLEVSRMEQQQRMAIAQEYHKQQQQINLQTREDAIAQRRQAAQESAAVREHQTRMQADTMRAYHQEQMEQRAAELEEKKRMHDEAIKNISDQQQSQRDMVDYRENLVSGGMSEDEALMKSVLKYPKSVTPGEGSAIITGYNRRQAQIPPMLQSGYKAYWAEQDEDKKKEILTDIKKQEGEWEASRKAAPPPGGSGKPSVIRDPSGRLVLTGAAPATASPTAAVAPAGPTAWDKGMGMVDKAIQGASAILPSLQAITDPFKGKVTPMEELKPHDEEDATDN